MDDIWKLRADPEAVTISGGEREVVVFTATYMSSEPRLARLAVEADQGTADSAWFTVDTPSIVMPGRSIAITVVIEPRVSSLQVGEQYIFNIRGVIESAKSEVAVTVTGPSRVQITVSHQRIDVAATGGYLVVFTVTNRTPEAVEVAVEAPYYAPNQLIWQTDAQVMYQLDASEQTVLAFGSAAFTLESVFSSFRPLK